MKKLTRPAAAHPTLDVLEDILGVKAADRTLTSLPLGSIRVTPGFNPRTAYLSENERENLFTPQALADLVLSMSEVQSDGQPRGVLQPIVVRPLGAGEYAVVAGERRFHAARLAGLTEVPVLVRSLNNEEALAAAIIENAQRLKVDQVAEALAGFRLMSALTGLDNEALVRHLNAIRQGEAQDTHNLDHTLRTVFGTGISTWSQQRARVLQLTEAERQAVQTGRLNAKAAFPLLKLGGDLAARQQVLDTLLAYDHAPSSTEAEALVRGHLPKVAAKASRKKAEPAVRLKALLPRLKAVPAGKADRLERLLAELEQLLDS